MKSRTSRPGCASGVARRWWAVSPNSLLRCPECGAKRLVPLSFQAARAAADDLERPEVVVLRPRAKCGGCGARIYPDTVTHRGDLSEVGPN